MDIIFTKISDQEHRLTIRRKNGSIDSSVLNSRSFLRHDLAHLAVELELPLTGGFWGSLAGGMKLSNSGFTGKDMALAEALAGPVQTLFRTRGDTEQFLGVLNRVCPEHASWDLAARIRERGRRLQGHWQATPYGEDMLIRWDEQTLSPVTSDLGDIVEADNLLAEEQSGNQAFQSSFSTLRYGTS